jgi:MSHA pilin protein MshC
MPALPTQPLAAMPSRWCRARALQRGARGFTLVELIMVIVILGVLAVYAAPKLFSTSDFYARGFHDETTALLRYAQKTAVAQRRTVCVTFNTSITPNSAVLTMEALHPGASKTVDCGINLAGPNVEGAAKVTAKSGTGYGTIKTGSASVTRLIFNGLGQPVNSERKPLTAKTVIEITDAANITVEPETGYVHD